MNLRLLTLSAGHKKAKKFMLSSDDLDAFIKAGPRCLHQLEIQMFPFSKSPQVMVWKVINFQLHTQLIRISLTRMFFIYLGG